MTEGADRSAHVVARRRDRTAVGVALALLVTGFVVQPVALRLDVEQRVADACFPWPVPGAMRYDFETGERSWAFLFRTPPPDPWGRPWAFRAHTAADAARVVPLRFDPADPLAPVLKGRPPQVVYSLGPDGQDDGGVAGPDVVVERPALRRLTMTDAAAGAGGWLAGLGLLAWLSGRRAARRRRWLLAGLPLALGALLAVGRTVGRVEASGALLGAVPALPLVIPLPVAVGLSLAALLGLVAALGWATTRGQCAGEGEGSGAAGA